jgi:O-antigen/teichoic acid export membrane protein
VRPLASTFAARLFTGLVVVGADQVVLRSFDTATFGAFKTLTSVRIGIQALALVYAANTFFVARDPKTLPAVAANSLRYSAAAGGAIALLLCAVAAAFPSWTAPLPLPLVLLFFATAPAILASFLESAAFLGAGWIGAWNAPIVANRVVMVLGLGSAALVATVRTPATPVATLFAAEVVAVAVALALVARRGLWSWRFDAPLFRDMSRYGAVAWLHAVFGFAILKGDILLVGPLAGAHERGQFAAGMDVREAVLFFPWIASMLLLPRVAATPGDRGRHALALALPSLGIATLGGAAIFAFAPETVSLLFGASYAPAVPIVRVMVPGALLAGYAHLLYQDLLGRGAPRTVVTTPAVALAVSLAGNAFAIPRWGALGAAWTSLATSAVLAVLATWAFRRRQRETVTPAGGAAPAAQGAGAA